MALIWEKLDTEWRDGRQAPSSRPSLCRAKVNGGWLVAQLLEHTARSERTKKGSLRDVTVVEQSHVISSIFFFGDPHHRWDDNSLP